MLRNYVKIALRNLRKNPAYAMINVAGLALGIACCTIMLLYVREELTFDAFHQKAERIYRLTETRQSPEQGERHFPYTKGPVGPTLVADFPEIVSAVRMRDRQGAGRFTVRAGEQRFYEGDHLIAEASFFEVFDFKLVQGEAASALQDPLSVVLTETAAQKYFGDQNPMGQVLNLERIGDCKVTGILQDPPANSHIDFSMLISFATLEAVPGWKRFIDSWESDSFITYVLAQRPLEVEAFNAKLPAFFQKYRGANPAQAHALKLQPLAEIHFHSAHLEFDRNRAKGQIAHVYIFGLIAFFVLFIACINFMNLATAAAMKRAKEIGMRKVVGAHKRQLLGQFLGESLLLAGLALLCAIALVEFVLPVFNALADKKLALHLIADPVQLASLLGLGLLIGLVAGSYPALYLSRLRPALMFKEENKTGGARLRRGLVVAQFALSIIMIVATLAARKQLEFIRTKNLGFNQDQLVVIDINSRNTRSRFAAIKNAMRKIPAVQSVSVSSRVPGEWKNLTQIEAAPEGAAETELRTMYFLGIDEDFLRTFEMNLVAGRNLSGAMGTDTSAILINETAARALGWEEPLNRELRVPAENYRARVAGVVKDFHFQSLHEPIAPLVLGHWNNPVSAIDYFTARIESANLPQTLAALQKVHEQFDQVTPFEYNFLDERLHDSYQTDMRVGKIFGAAATLTIFIACLGLLGLAAFTAEQRTKEIGVRKVLGASLGNIMLLLSKDFARLVLLATLLASPIAYLALQKWLQNFAYRITLGFETFLLAGLLALFIALLTVGYQALKAALANPVAALRYE